MNDDLEDYEKHVWDQVTHEDGIMRSWCNRKLDIVLGTRGDGLVLQRGGEWVFLGANHAALSLKQGMMTLPCRKCRAEIIKVLSESDVELEVMLSESGRNDS